MADEAGDVVAGIYNPLERVTGCQVLTRHGSVQDWLAWPPGWEHAKQEKLFIDELWTAHPAFHEKKNNLSFKKPGITLLSITLAN